MHVCVHVCMCMCMCMCVYMHVYMCLCVFMYMLCMHVYVCILHINTQAFKGQCFIKGSWKTTHPTHPLIELIFPETLTRNRRIWLKYIAGHGYEELNFLVCYFSHIQQIFLPLTY